MPDVIQDLLTRAMSQHRRKSLELHEEEILMMISQVMTQVVEVEKYPEQDNVLRQSEVNEMFTGSRKTTKYSILGHNTLEIVEEIGKPTKIRRHYEVWGDKSFAEFFR